MDKQKVSIELSNYYIEIDGKDRNKFQGIILDKILFYDVLIDKTYDKYMVNIIRDENGVAFKKPILKLFKPNEIKELIS